MKKKVYAIFVLITLLLNIEAIPINNFSSVEKKINEISEFVENGVKVEYTTSNSIEEEIKILELKLGKILNKYQIEFKDNSLNIQTDNELYIINVFQKNIYTKVDISIINYDKDINLDTLMNRLRNLKDNKSNNLRYFQYVKGKINNKEEMANKLKETKELKNINTLKIHNGYVGTASLYNGERVNYTISSYDTGSYLIIGTPIIFTTY